jgi:Flp pilus assembly protein TadD
LAGVKYDRVDNTKGALEAYRLAMEVDPLTEVGLLARIMVAAYLRGDSQTGQATALPEEMVNMSDGAIRDYAVHNNKYGLGCAYFWRGRARQELGQLRTALEDLNKAVRYRPDWGMAHLSLAYAYLKVSDVKSARREYRASGIIDEFLTREIEAWNNKR